MNLIPTRSATPPRLYPSRALCGLPLAFLALLIAACGASESAIVGVAQADVADPTTDAQTGSGDAATGSDDTHKSDLGSEAPDSVVEPHDVAAEPDDVAARVDVAPEPDDAAVLDDAPEPDDAAVLDDVAPQPEDGAAAQDTGLEPDDVAAAEKVAPEPEDVAAAEEVAPEPEDVAAAEDVAPEPDDVIAPEDVAPEPEDVSGPEDVAPEPEDVSAPDDVAPEPEDVSAPEDVAPEPDDIASPEDVAPEPEDGRAPEDVAPEPEDVPAPEDAAPEPDDVPAPEDAAPEPDDVPAPEDAPPEPEDVPAPLDVAPEPEDVAAPLDIAPEPDDVPTPLDVAPEPDDVPTPLDVSPGLEDVAPPDDIAVDPDTSSGGDPEPTGPKVLVFVAYEGVWWAEYKVVVEALTASGWTVDVRSSSEGVAFTYQTDGNIESSANTASGSSYAVFAAQFAASFGVPWDSAWNAPGVIPLAGRLQDVANLDDYDALVAVGGVGARHYRLDGTYAAVGSGLHNSDAAAVQAASEAFARLALEALHSGKPVLTECHGAPLAAFVRAPGTAGPNSLGTSILFGRTATGYPLNDGDTAAVYAQLGVTYLPQRPLVIDGPLAPALGGTLSGRSRVLTTRDWYPQTVSHAAVTLRNAIRTFPTPMSAEAPKLVLVIHGGPVNLAACGAWNKTTNDVPCNYGTSPAEVLPADVNDLRALLESNSPNDAYDLVVDDLDLMADDPGLDLYDEGAIRSALAAYESVVYFKHWGTGMTNELELALLDYADDGGGLVSIHHGLYNDAGSKNLLAFEGFEASSEPATWGARPPSAGPFALMAVSHGHFVTTQGVDFNAAPVLAAGGVPLPAYVPNPIAAGYPAFFLVDEIYTNTIYTGPQQVGDGPAELMPLFANNASTWPAQTATAGFSRRYDPSEDGTIGRLVYLQPGERKANYLVTSPYGQVIRNAVVWSATPD